MRRKSSSKKESISWKCWATKKTYFEIESDDIRKNFIMTGKDSWAKSGLLPTLVNKLVLEYSHAFLQW